MVLEDRDPAEIEKVMNFCREVGLPTTLADLGITDPPPICRTPS